MFPIRYADIIIPLPFGDTFTYAIPPALEENICVGMRVSVQFGKRKYYSGIVFSIHQNKPSDDVELKYIDELLDNHPIIHPIQIELWKWISRYYCCSIGEVYKAALPSGLKLESETRFYANIDFNNTEILSNEEEQILLHLANNRASNISAINKATKLRNSFPTLKRLLEKKAIFVEEKMRNDYKKKLLQQVKLHKSLDGLHDFSELISNLNRAQKQKHLFLFILNELKNQETKTIDKKTLLAQSNSTQAILQELVKKNYLEIIELEIGRIELSGNTNEQLNELSPAQQVAFEQIKGEFSANKPVLLQGVTSSGKTEIYFKLIKEQLNQQKQVLFLVPEIGLTTQLITRLKHAFGDKAGIYHSKFNDSERIEIWHKILESNPEQYRIIIGARSAALLPFSNLGLIIVDEEHEQAYKQIDPSPRYHARDLAIVLGHMHKANILLGSATPSVESYFNTQSKKYGLVALTERYKNVKLPKVIIADIKEATRKKQMVSLLTPQLHDAINQALENGEQAIVFQNRRGYAPYIQCKQCGWIPKCNNCDVSLTFHKAINYLNCHYCGAGASLPDECPSCKHKEINSRGFGTEKIEEELALVFPNAKVARMDLDSTRNKNSYEQLISAFENKQIDILVGTQMITKGLDFEHVSVVGILNADLLINFPDFRAYERAYQMLTQVSGRAGRRNKQGTVIIQSSQPEHEVLEMVQKHDFTKLFNETLIERKLFRYPPYFRLIKVVMKHRFKETLNPAAKMLANQLRTHFQQQVLGPEYPLVARVQAQYLKEIWIKIPRNENLALAKQKILHEINSIKKMKNNSSISIYIDVDPS